MRMNELTHTLTSLEIAEMVGREHNEVLKDVRRITDHLDQGNLPHVEYFIESAYRGGNGQNRPSYLLTKKGCELYATRMTGEKGTLFAVEYIERFNKMELHIQKQAIPQVTSAELIAMIAQQGVDQERRITVVEEKQDNIVSILSMDVRDWRNEVNRIINAIVMKLGGGEYYREIRNESYQLLESRAACNLDIRLQNRKSKMLMRGSSKTAINKMSKLDVIAEDKKLISVYMTVIKELAIKYQLNLSKYQLTEMTGE